MAKNKVEAECTACSATGLYKGFAEKNCAVVCSDCGGTGKVTIEYTPFNKRKSRSDVTKVFKSSFGYGHTDKDFKTKEGAVIRFSQGGCSYQEWASGVKPKPVKDLYCPYLWSNQDLQNKDVNGLYNTKCTKGLAYGGRITECKNYKTKSKCWEIYEGAKNGKD